MPTNTPLKHLKGYRITSDAGDREWAADDEAHARSQHLDAFPDEPIVAVTELAPWWVYIWRDDSPDLAVGPYATETIAGNAMQDSALIDSLCVENCIECLCDSTQPHEQQMACEIVYIDPEDPNHFG